MTLPPLYVLRHGQTEWNRAGRLQGWQDSPLTETGRAHAARQGEILREVLRGDARWVTSPLGRALHTARIAGAPDHLAHDTRLREIDMGRWTGLSSAQIATERPDLEGFARYEAIPEGETLADLTHRVAAFLAEQAGQTGPMVIITHGITSRILRCLATGQPPEHYTQIGGGQGVVYHIENGAQNLLS